MTETTFTQNLPPQEVILDMLLGMMKTQAIHEAVHLNRAMAGFSHQVDQPLVEGYDYASFSTIVDVGGGYGGWLATILRQYPHLRGIVFDLPHVIEDAQQQASSTTLDPFPQFVAGDMFQPDAIPQADAYILRQIIKDWDDEAAIRILANCRRAMKPGGKILVAEQVIRPGAGVMVPTKLIDLQLMGVLSGQERTESQYEALFEAAGLHLAKIWPTHSLYSILEAVSH